MNISIDKTTNDLEISRGWMPEVEFMHDRDSYTMLVLHKSYYKM